MRCTGSTPSTSTTAGVASGICSRAVSAVVRSTTSAVWPPCSRMSRSTRSRPASADGRRISSGAATAPRRTARPARASISRGSPRTWPLSALSPKATARSWKRGSSAASFLRPRELRHQQLRVHRRDQLAERLGTGFQQVDDLLRGLLAGQPLGEDADLFADELLEGALVTDRVVDGEADLLPVATGAEARDRLDDPHVGCAVAARRRRQDAQLREPVEHLLRHVVALADLGS